MNIFLRGAACAPLLALVAGCCANNVNNCDDLYADSLYLMLSRDTNNPNSFSEVELDTVYLQRYNPATPTTLSDPVIIIAKAQQATLNSKLKAKLTDAKLPLTTLVISNNSPFPPSTTGGKLNAYGYLLTVQDKSAPPRTPYTFRLDNIQLKGQYYADGCNTCYQNTQKSFRLTGKQTQEKTVTETAGQPVAVTISKAD